MPRPLLDALVELDVSRCSAEGREEHELLNSCRHRPVEFGDP